MPVNQVWPGYQRPQEQTEIASFAYFDFSGQVSIEMTSNKEIKSVDIRPKSYGIKPVIKGNTIKFDLSRPCKK
jgi:DNA-binding protein YbaB